MVDHYSRWIAIFIKPCPNNQLIKTVAEANKDLIQLHKQIKDIKAGDTVVNNNAETKIGNAIFVGSTAELQKLIKGQVSDIQRLENENP